MVVGGWSSVNGVKLGLGFICVYAVVIGSRVGANAMVLAWDGWIEKFWIWGLLIQRKGEAKRVGLALLIGNAWLRTVLVSRC